MARSTKGSILATIQSRTVMFVNPLLWNSARSLYHICQTVSCAKRSAWIHNRFTSDNDSYHVFCLVRQQRF